MGGLIKDDHERKTLVGEYFVNLVAQLLGAKKLRGRVREKEGDLYLPSLNVAFEVKAANKFNCFLVRPGQLDNHFRISVFPYDYHLYFLFRYRGARAYRPKDWLYQSPRIEYFLSKKTPTKTALKRFLSSNIIELFIFDVSVVRQLVQSVKTNSFTASNGRQCELVKINTELLRSASDFPGPLLVSHQVRVGIRLFGQIRVFPVRLLVELRVVKRLTAILRQRGMLAK